MLLVLTDLIVLRLFLSLGFFFGLLLFAYILIYGWFVAKHALGLPGGPAATIVALDMAVTMFWKIITDGMIRG